MSILRNNFSAVAAERLAKFVFSIFYVDGGRARAALYHLRPLLRRLQQPDRAGNGTSGADGLEAACPLVAERYGRLAEHLQREWESVRGVLVDHADEKYQAIIL